MPNSKVIKAKNQIVKTLKNRELIIIKDGIWIQKIDLPNKGKIIIEIEGKQVYSD